MIVVNTIHTFVLLRDGNLIFWWPNLVEISSWKGDRGWEKGEGGRMERGGEKMRETGDKAKRKKGGEGRKESRDRERRRGVGEDYPLSSPS
jgi:hypothetical protein